MHRTNDRNSDRLPKDATVLVTGTSSGLGLETAVHLAECGFRVYATMRCLERRSALDAEAARRSVRMEVLELDVTRQDQIDAAVTGVLGSAGRIDALINNAGIVLRGCFEDLDESEIRSVFDTDLFGAMALTRAVLPCMRAARQGRIVLVTSVGGRIGGFGVSAYCAAKFAAEGFGESLAQELLPFGIRVSMVAPAIIKTPCWSNNRGVSRRALEPSSAYRSWFQNSERLADRMVESSPATPADVGRAIQHALTSPRPRLRYVVGRRAALALALRKYLPEGVFERLYFGEIRRRVTTTRGKR